MQSSDRAAADRWLTPTLGGERRWASRADVQFAAKFRARQLTRLDVEVLNFSRFGCAIRGALAPTAGGYCWLTIPTLESWYASVAWQDGNAFGLDFAEPFHAAVADMIVGRALL